MTPTDLPKDWPLLFREYGPFFLALLLLTVLSVWGFQRWREVAQSNAKKNEVNLCFWVYAALPWLLGMVVGLAAVVYWFVSQPSVFVFSGQFQNLAGYVRVVPAPGEKDLYIREIGTAVEGTQLRKTVEFVAVSSSRFAAGTQFAFLFGKAGSDNLEAKSVPYDGSGSRPIYDATCDEDGKWNLRSSKAGVTPPRETSRASQLTIALWSVLVPALHAASGTGREAADPQSQDTAPEQMMVLQSERALVGAKIAAVDWLLALDQATLEKISLTKTAKEPMIVTLLDLTRHGDAELAAKARRVVARLNLTNTLSRELRSGDAGRVSSAKAVVGRLEKEQAAKVLDAVGPLATPDLKTFAQKVRTDGTSALRPTGSAQGDRYYVKAVWDPNKKETVTCLTDLFSRKLLNRTSPEAEARVMRGRSERIVYWYSKEWAITIAADITACGASASFITQ